MRMGDNYLCKPEHRGGSSMDIFTVLAAVVAVITTASAYLLFNGVPDFRSMTDTQRQTRRP